MESGNIVLHYKGAVEYKTVNKLIRRLQDEFSKRNFPITLYKRLLVVMIELLENIYKYCDPQCLSNFSEDAYPEILIQKNKDHFIIRASNPLLQEHEKTLHERLDKINSLNRSALMEAYKHTITDGIFTEKGGAGLGLLEIARISALPIKYTFTAIDESHAIYMIEVAIDK